jgi:hypothetical protein
MSSIFGIKSVHRPEEKLSTAIASNLRSPESQTEHDHYLGKAFGRVFKQWYQPYVL